jgi:hypothetical protein
MLLMNCVRGWVIDMFVFPLPANYSTITSNYGQRNNPVTGQPQFHSGIDFKAPAGTPIYAIMGGIVIHSGNYGTGGLTVRIRHFNSYVSEYMHCSRLLVKVGDQVHIGQKIAEVGTTGNSTGNHLHLGLIDSNKNYVNPINYLNQNKTSGIDNVSNYVSSLFTRASDNKESNIGVRVEKELHRVFEGDTKTLALLVGMLSIILAGDLIIRKD